MWSAVSWDRLRVFAAVAEHGSLARAAEALHISGPAVSQQVRKLEREARCRLVEPAGRGIRLTPAGLVLAGHARELADRAALAERDVVSVTEAVLGPLRVGAVASVVRAVLPAALRELTRAHPRLEPTVRDGEVVDLIPELVARRLDVVVLESWPVRPASLPAGVRTSELFVEDVRLAVPAEHRLARRPAARLAELGGEYWTACLPLTDQHGAVLQLLRAVGVEPDIRYTIFDYATQLALVAAGLAVALIPRSARRPVSGVRYLPCEPPVHRQVAAAWTEAGHTPAVAAFVTGIRPPAGGLSGTGRPGRSGRAARRPGRRSTR